MSEELKACGKNGYGETFWKLCVPDEHCTPGLEVGIVAGDQGLTFGGRLIPWSEIDKARTTHPAPAEQVEVVACVDLSTDAGVVLYANREPHLDDEILMTVAQHQRIMAATVPAGCKVALPEPDFVLDGGSTPCYYAETIRAILEAKDE